MPGLSQSGHICISLQLSLRLSCAVWGDFGMLAA
jgi:hypothetical protein